MIRKLLLICLFIGMYSHAQYNEGAPWMDELKKSKAPTSKNGGEQYSLYEISEAFHTYWADKDSNKKGSGFKPYMRWENYWNNFIDSEGYLPTSKELWDSWTRKQDRIGKVVNPTSTWNQLGPVNSGVIPGRLPGQGRVNAIAVDPNAPDTWYLGSPAGGIWKSTNAGGSWTNLLDDFPQIGVSGIAIDPNNSDIVYIATGDDDGGDSFSIGVFKSLDGGDTWNQTGLNPSTSNISTRMNEITIDPTNSNIVWVGTNSGLFKSLDGGDTWDNVRSGNIRDFKLKPGDPNTIYAVSSRQYFKSTDGGTTFTEITSNLPTNSGRLAIGVTPADPQRVYIISAATNNTFQGLFRSIDSGETFSQTSNTTDIFESNQAFFDLAIEVSPTDANTVFIGVLNIWRSNNGGDSFTQLNQWFVNNEAYSHADIHTLKFFNDTLFCGSDGGLYISDDNGATFNNRTSNASISQFYRISVAQNDPNRIAGGTQDNAGFIFNNGEWNVYTGGDGMDYEIDPNNSDLIYGFVQNGGTLFITNNAGQNITRVPAPTSNGNSISGNWITPLAVGSDGSVYSGYDAIYRLEGGSWSRISTPLGSSNVDDLEVDPNDPMILYAAVDDFLFRSTNGGSSFRLLTRLNSEISSIATNSTDSNIVYVTTSRRVGISQNAQPAERGVFKITINGTSGTAEDITLNLPTDQAFFSIAHQGRHTDNPIFVGTSLGVYRLDDTLTEWEEYFTGLPSTAVGDLDINENAGIITAGTYGRGIWQSPIPVQVPDNDVRLISVTPEANAVLCGEIFSEITVQNNGLNPISEINIDYNLNGGGNLNFVWNGTLNSNETTTIALPAFSVTEFGATALNVTTTITDDTFADNNTASTTFFANDFGTGDEVFDFESEANSLVTFNEGSDESVWERGVPTGTLLNTASSGTQVLGTNLDGNYPNNTTGIILSGCYELSSILAPILTFNMAYDLEDNFDIVYVQYSTNDGTDWNLLGTTNSQPNWYTNNGVPNNQNCQNCVGGQWTGTNTTMTTYAYDFVANAANGEIDLTGESNIIFRIVFQSDVQVDGEGVIIDDFVVTGFQDDDDDDNDGVLDVDDNCPLIGNSNQLDTDNDGEGNACDDDDDGDGILDINDNCPLTANPDQSDVDGDGIGDVCDTDADNDGVPNDRDLCPDTPTNAVVDVDGCEVFSLPVTNFRVLTTGESCISSNNGSISIEAVEALNYTATLTQGGNAVGNADFTASTTFDNLTSGEYTLCITVAGQADYENCFAIQIVEPEPLSVTSKVSTLKSEVTLNLSGSTNYTININNVVYQTSLSEITLPLPNIENVISVKTDKDCQGVFLETVILNSEAFVYPNPITNGNLTVVLDDPNLKNVQLALYSLNGITIFRKGFDVVDGKVSFDVDGLSRGVYLLNVRTDKELLNYKIVRR